VSPDSALPDLDGISHGAQMLLLHAAITQVTLGGLGRASDMRRYIVDFCYLAGQIVGGDRLLEEIRLKDAYNQTRSYRHGGKAF
jgi:hypothetical protein